MPFASTTHRRRRGYSLVEVVVVLTIVGLLAGMAAPTFHRAVEQSRADIAAANLRAIWAAQRLFWLDGHTYAADLTTLSTTGLLDREILNSSGGYTYDIASADNNAFEATATRTQPTSWTGSFTIDETGVMTGVLQCNGEADISVGFQ